MVITGSTSGIGAALAAKFAPNCRLVLVSRNEERGAALVQKLRDAGARAVPQLVIADLSRIPATLQAAREIANGGPVDVLVNNAGGIFVQRTLTAEGLEMTAALNHMAYVTLTLGLLEALRAAPAGRIVSVASRAHRGQALRPTYPSPATHHRAWTEYQQSKLANILFTRSLARRVRRSGVVAACLHPGFVASSFGDNNTGLFGIGFGLLKSLFAIPPEQAAATVAALATGPEVAGMNGGYFENGQLAIPSTAGQDDERAEKLWTQSLRFAGLAEPYPSD